MTYNRDRNRGTNNEEIFYLQRLGLSYNDATKLLIKGFLKKDMPKSMDKYTDKMINKYWR